MALIPASQLHILKPAADLVKIATTAIDDNQLARVAYALNTAANGGDHSIKYPGEILSNNVKDTLEKSGYSVVFVNDPIGAYYSISAKKSK